MKRITVQTPAKINLFLEVTGKRPDGYHELSTVFQAVGLYDELTLEKTEEEGILLEEAEGSISVPLDETNLMFRAAALIFSAFELPGGLCVRFEKRIPVGAGLGGGSSDAAAVLYGLNELYELELTGRELRSFAVKLGADVAFFLEGGTCYASGIGEELTPLPGIPGLAMLILKPETAVSTREVFRALDLEGSKEVCSADRMVSLLCGSEGQAEASLARELHNALEPVTERFLPDVAVLRRLLSENGASGALMSGSGSAVFGLYENRSAAEEAEKEILKRVDGPLFSCLTETVPDGIRIIGKS